MDDKYLSDDVREAMVLAEEELKPKPPRIPCSGKQMRKLWRGIARARMTERGVKKFNHRRRLKSGKTTSMFAKQWREWCCNS